MKTAASVLVLAAVALLAGCMNQTPPFVIYAHWTGNPLAVEMVFHDADQFGDVRIEWGDGEVTALGPEDRWQSDWNEWWVNAEHVYPAEGVYNVAVAIDGRRVPIQPLVIGGSDGS